MKTRKRVAIVYYSTHHQNTEQLVRSFVDGIDIIPVAELENTDLSSFDLVGFASGIYAGRFAPEIYEAIKQHLPELKRVFLVYTSGTNNPKYTKRMRAFLQEQGLEVMGSFACRGYNTFGPFKLIGGTNKGHPDKQDFKEYQKFIKKLVHE